MLATCLVRGSETRSRHRCDAAELGRLGAAVVVAERVVRVQVVQVLAARRLVQTAVAAVRPVAAGAIDRLVAGTS